MKRLLESFYARPVEEVARDLVGKLVRHEEVLVRITEVEAYAGPEDSASHARFGPTARNLVMFGPPGRAYVYLCYGLHHMLNVVAEPEGRGAAVLIRSVEVVEGLQSVLARRRQPEGSKLLAGPGKVAQGLGLSRVHDGVSLVEGGPLVLLDDDAQPPLFAGPRVGIDFARVRDRRQRWRFAAAGSGAVTRPGELRPAGGAKVLKRVFKCCSRPRTPGSVTTGFGLVGGSGQSAEI